MILETFKEASDAVEEINKRIVACAIVLGRLVIDIIITR
jgi:hypothetical protein